MLFAGGKAAGRRDRRPNRARMHAVYARDRSCAAATVAYVRAGTFATSPALLRWLQYRFAPGQVCAASVKGVPEPFGNVIVVCSNDASRLHVSLHMVAQACLWHQLGFEKRACTDPHAFGTTPRS